MKLWWGGRGVGQGLRYFVGEWGSFGQGLGVWWGGWLEVEVLVGGGRLVRGLVWGVGVWLGIEGFGVGSGNLARG